MSRTVTLGLSLEYPDYKSQSWDSLFKTGILEPISSHDHTGSGNGTQLGTNSLSDNAVTGLKIRLANNQAIRARNAANSADIDILKVDSLDNVYAPNGLKVAGTLDAVTLNRSDGFLYAGSDHASYGFIAKANNASQLVVSDGFAYPYLNNDLSLGSATYRFADFHTYNARIYSTLTINTLTSSASITTSSDTVGSDAPIGFWAVTVGGTAARVPLYAP